MFNVFEVLVVRGFEGGGTRAAKCHILPPFTPTSSFAKVYCRCIWNTLQKNWRGSFIEKKRFFQGFRDFGTGR